MKEKRVAGCHVSAPFMLMGSKFSFQYIVRQEQIHFEAEEAAAASKTVCSFFAALELSPSGAPMGRSTGSFDLGWHGYRWQHQK